MNLPTELPIWGAEQAILTALKQKPVVIVSAETGSGKSTQIPQMLWQVGYTYGGQDAKGRTRQMLIGITQPRRLAAASVAKRVAKELSVELGAEVGFQVRFAQEVGPETEIKFATEGIFLLEARQDPLFSRYSVLMLDEVHERSIEMDALLGLVKLAIEKREDLRVVVSSATVNIPALVQFFGDDAVVVECQGRLFPVEQRFEKTEPSALFRYDRRGHEIYGLAELAADKAANIIGSGETGDILVFLAGFDQLERAEQQFRLKGLNNVEILLAHGEMPLEQLERLFEPHICQRVVFATNVAESSITIPGIRVVIDSGRVKKDFYSPETKIVELREVSASRSSSLQRAGRAGRTQAGICCHLFTSWDSNNRPEYDLPAVQRSNLENVLLSLAAVGVRDFEQFPFVDQPAPGLVESAVAELLRIGALSADRELTAYGRQVAAFPLAPKLAHLLLQAASQDALAEMATFLAMLETNPVPRNGRNGDQNKNQGYLQLIRECESDPEALLVLWEQYYQSGFDWNWARQMGLRPKAMQEVRQVRGQLLEIASGQGLKPSSAAGNYYKLKAALIRALPEHLLVPGGRTHAYYRPDKHDIYIFPGSLVFDRGPRLLWFYELRQTSKLFAHYCMPVTVKELKEAYPELMTVTSEEKGGLFGTTYVYRVTSFGGLEIDRDLLETRQSVKPETPRDSWWSKILPGAAERARAEREKQAQELLQQLPAIPQDAPAEVKQSAQRIRDSLTRQPVWLHQLEETEQDTKKLRQKLQELKETRQQAAELEQKICACQQELDEYAELLDKCPLCSRPLLDAGCGCAQHYSDSQLGIKNGDTDVNLVWLESETGEVLARIFLCCPEGAPKRVSREVSQLTGPFQELDLKERSV